MRTLFNLLLGHGKPLHLRQWVRASTRTQNQSQRKTRINPPRKRVERWRTLDVAEALDVNPMG